MTDGFVAHGRLRVAGAPQGPLAGLTFAVKDLFDVAGTRSGWGNPDRLREAEPAVTTAPAVAAALAAGATLIGKTITDELACGMFGENPHDGTPPNPAAPDRVPGGSSSGSAAVVAAGLADVAFGTDTGGSVRVPASFCGLYGIRTSHGRISTAGVMPMAPSFDVVGWLARDAQTLRRVGEVFFGPIAAEPPQRLLWPEDALALCEAPIREALRQKLPNAEPIRLYPAGAEEWLEVFRPLQLAELFTTHAAWALRPGRTLSPAVRQRLELAATITADQVRRALPKREALTARLHALLPPGTMMLLPTAHDLPPCRPAGMEAQIAFRERTLALTCVASLCRLPQVSIPWTQVDGVPVGLSLIAGPMQDAALLAAAEALAR
ncbi:MAG: amidase [Rhodovarius sp.]|nr:amidase [Rhodovarius sp.]